MAFRPTYTFTGTHELVLENHTIGQVYVLYLKSSGTLTMGGSYYGDIAVVGGGGGGKTGEAGYEGGGGSMGYIYSGGGGGKGGAGGGAGQYMLVPKMVLPLGAGVLVGAGANMDANGASTTFYTFTAKGGVAGGGAAGGSYAGTDGLPGSPGSAGSYLFGQSGSRKCCATGGGGGGGGTFKTKGSYHDSSWTGYGAPGGSAVGGGTGGKGHDGAGGGAANGSGGNAYLFGSGGGGGGGSGYTYVPTMAAGSGRGAAGVVAIRFLNAAPGTPSNLLTVGNQAGEQAVSTVSATFDPEGDAISYVWEQRSDNNTFTQIGMTPQPTLSYSVPTTGTTFTRRVKAVDVQGAESDYVIGAPMNINYNRAPTISDQDRILGLFSEAPPAWNGTASDPDGDALTVQCFLDDQLIQTRQGTNVEIAIYPIEIWNILPNGAHTLKVMAKDPQGASATRALRFTKAEHALCASTAIYTSGRVSTAMINCDMTAPTDATVRFFACNNADDELPTWEDVTAAVNETGSIVLTNTQKTGAKWAFGFAIVGEEGASGQAIVFRGLTANLLTAG